jgi:autotransporter-associated beta strand protein
MATNCTGLWRFGMAVLLCAAPMTQAGTYVRTAVNVPLTNPAAWDLGAVPGSGDIVVWTSTSATGATTNGGSLSWSGIVFNATAAVTIINGSGLHTTNTLGSGGVDMSHAGADLTFQSDAIVLAATVICDITNNRTLSFSGKPPDISGPGGFVKIGSGTLQATSPQNDYSGNTVISNGTFTGGQKDDFLPHGAGKGDVTVAAGAFLSTAQNSLTVNGLFGNGTIQCSFNKLRTVTVGDGDAAGVFGGTFTSSFPTNLSLIKIGTNTFTLTGTNNQFHGGTIVSNGTLIVDNASGVATGTNVVTIITNGTLSGMGFITGPVSVNGTIAPGNEVGTLTTGSQTWNPGGSLGLNLDPSGGSGFLAVNGNINIQSTPSTPFTIKLISLNGSTPGNLWTLATVTGTVQNFSANKFALDVSRFQPPTPASVFAIELSGASLRVRLSKPGTVLQVK